MALILPFVFAPLPTYALASETLEIHPLSLQDTERYPVLSRIRTFDDAIALIRSIEREALDPRCTAEEIQIIVKFIAFSAKVGSLVVPVDEDVLNQEIQALLDEVDYKRDYSFSKPIPLEEAWGYAKTSIPGEYFLLPCSWGGFFTDVGRACKGTGRALRKCGDAIVTGIAITAGAIAGAIASADVHDLPNVTTNGNPLTQVTPTPSSERMEMARQELREQERLYLEELAKQQREKEEASSVISNEQIKAAKELGQAIASQDFLESDTSKQSEVDQFFGEKLIEAPSKISSGLGNGTIMGIALAVPAAVMAVEAAPLVLLGSAVAVATYAGYSAYESGVAGVAMDRVSKAKEYVKSSVSGLFYGSEGVGLPGEKAQDDRLPEPNVESGKRLDREGYTQAGRSGQKHGDRKEQNFPKPKGNIKEINEHGQRQLEEIVHYPKAEKFKNKKGGVDIHLPDGRGARFNRDGAFENFLGPRGVE